jgi:hypothetical protein
MARDRNVTTSASPATAVDAAFDLLAELTGPKNAARIRLVMGFRSDGI